jgi:hypothetical protein
MIKLYMYAAAFGLRNPSPFCLKVEMALKFLGLDYEVGLLGDPRKARRESCHSSRWRASASRTRS